METQRPTGSPQDRPTEDQHRQMIHFGITAEQRTVYVYQGYVYERVADALAYARISAAKVDATTAAAATPTLFR